MNRSELDIIKELLRKHLQDELSPQEQQQLKNWTEQSDNNRLFFEQMTDSSRFDQSFRQFVHSKEKILAALKEQIPALQHVQETTHPETSSRIRQLPRWSWAAAALLVLIAGAWLWNRTLQPQAGKSAGNLPAADIAPGKSGAVLTLANGSQVELDSVDGGLIATQNGTTVVLRNGQLTYDPSGKTNGEITYNTMSTSRGRQFDLMLPDGSRIWLNAASSVKFPTSFTGSTRRISITGEVYVEVAKNVNKPFLVDIDNKAEVEVLGTSFNINAYSNEPTITTTLITGSVRLKTKTPVAPSQTNNALLKPGQQASINPASNAGITINRNADTDRIMAWKNGMFYFEGVDLKEIMRQLERWYDIEVEYQKEVKNVEFVGGITRDLPLSGLLKALQKSDIHFRLENRKLIIMP